MTLEELCKKYEHYETDPWAAKAILSKELITTCVVDPCCGSGILSEAARENGADIVVSSDIHDWGYLNHWDADFLSEDIHDVLGEFFFFPSEATCFMNPPFSKAVEFVERAISLGFKKIICFQRFAWFESKKRKEFWDKNPPSRIWVCGDRATCWRHDIQEEKRKTSGNTTTAHAFFVWEREAPAGTVLSRIYKEDAA